MLFLNWHPNLWSVFILLMFGHYLGDFAFQSEYMAKGKNYFSPIPGHPADFIMSAHCWIHAGLVYIITGQIGLFLAEFGAHYLIDTLKCDGKISYKVDQILHIVCKMVWAIIMFTYLYKRQSDGHIIGGIYA